MKITCDVIQDLMPSYVDGILSEDSRELVEEHLKSCKECQKMLEIMQADQEKEKNQPGHGQDYHSSRGRDPDIDCGSGRL